MKKVLLAISVATALFANEYQDISQKFLEYQNSNKSIISQEILTKDNVEVGYLFNLSSGGYIIVPISKKLSPIKGYSFESNFENLPPKFKEYVLNQLYLAATDKSLAKVIDTTISDRWNFLENYTPSSNRTLYSYTPNTALLTTAWNQEYPYNKYFPKLEDDTTLAGCVQVAMGQVMNYHQYPARGQGVIKSDIKIQDASKNTVRTDTLKAVLNKYYNWDIMPTSHDDGLEYQNDELAYLMRDLLIVNSATAGVEETLASANTSALVENFGYSNTIARMDNSDSSFISTIKAQIDLEQPVLLSLPGHMVVADGYQDDSSGNYIHINMGWGGSNNDFYNLDDTIVTSSLSFPVSSGALDMIYNIKPCSQSNGDCYVNIENTDTLSGLNITGNFASDLDVDKYEVYLSGSTTFSGDRGYSNQAFYIAVYSSSGALVQDIANTDTTINLDADLYTVKASLCSVDNYCYTADSGFQDYTIDITSETVSDSQKATILESLEVAPVIDQNLSDKIILSDKNTSVLINAYDENSDDNLSFEAFGNSNVELRFDNNILNIHPTVSKGHSRVKVKVNSNGQSDTQEFDVLINDEEVYFGKEFTISDTFADQSEFDKHKAILNGVCTVSGYNGYSNQAFYTSLMNISENYLNIMNNTPFTTDDLTQNIYLLGASLDQNPEGNGQYYPYDDNNTAYNLTVSCPSADENITNIASLLNITLDDTIIEPFLFRGWNLVSADINLSDVGDSNTPVLWQYLDNNWSIYAPDISEANNLIQITEINSSIGTWILSSEDLELDIIENNTNIDYTNYPNGWSLNGTNKDISTSDISCASGSVVSVWKYSDNEWSVYAPDISQDTIKTMSSINKNEGFWVNCK
jgi:hypothetical protein